MLYILYVYYDAKSWDPAPEYRSRYIVGQSMYFINTILPFFMAMVLLEFKLYGYIPVPEYTYIYIYIYIHIYIYILTDAKLVIIR